jgi:hypothetical protein
VNFDNIEIDPTKGENQIDTSALTVCFTSNIINFNSITNDSMGIYTIDFIFIFVLDFLFSVLKIKKKRKIDT